MVKSSEYIVTYDDDIHRFKYADGRSEAYIDIFEIEQVGDRWQYTHPRNLSRWPRAYFLNDELFPLVRYRFGEITISGPTQPIPYLERQYGDWRTPQKWLGHHDS